MPSVSTVTVGSGGGYDYSSLSNAEAGEQANLVTADVQLDIECYSFQDTTAVVINGWTTDATRYLRIFTPSGERHDGKWNTSKYRLVVSGATPLIINEDYVRIEGLQVSLAGSVFSNSPAIFITGTAVAASSNIQVSETIAWYNASQSGTNYGLNAGSGTVNIRNSVFIGTATGSIGVQCTFLSNGCVMNADNCTSVNCGTYGFNRASGTMTLRNCYSGGNGTNAYNGTMTRTTCAHDTATSFTGSTGSIAFDTGNFTNVTAGSEDLHLAGSASATLVSGGTDLSGTFTIDIDGDTRSDWSIGADEVAGGGGAGAARRRRLICAGAH